MMKAPTTAKELFEQLAVSIAASKDEARKIDATILFKIGGENGGDWLVDCSANPPEVLFNSDKKASCTIECLDEDFERALETPAAGMELYFQGKIRIIGDPMIAMKLGALFGLIKA